MHTLAEIQEAIEQLPTNERLALRDWLDQTETLAVVQERVRQIRAGEATLLDGERVQEEMRQLAQQTGRE
jgi:hypothetical protein